MFDAIDFHEMRKLLASKLRTIVNYTMHWQSIFPRTGDAKFLKVTDG